jgi:hypothetical protein
MDFETFLLAVSDIANTLYQNHNNDSTGVRGESQALLTLIRDRVTPLDECIQRTEKGNNS